MRTPPRKRSASTSPGPLGMNLAPAADGILRIAVTAMSYAVKASRPSAGWTRQRSRSIAYGGAGPLHASAIAREIGMRRLIVPRAPGHFCAFGMLHSDLRYDFVRTGFTRLDDVSFDEIKRSFDALALPREEVARKAARQDRRRLRRRHALRRPGAPGDGRSAGCRLRPAQPRRRSRRASTTCTSGATARARRRSAPRSSACASRLRRR